MILVSSLLMFVNAQPASAAGVNAVAGETICNQDVGNSTGVTAYRVASEFCVVEFRNVGTTTWTVPNGVTAIDYLVVAGGGGGAGGQASEHGGGGGGAGGVRSGTYSITSSPIAISVGGGGNGGAANTAGVKGTDSTLAGSITSVGGGRGGTYFSPNAPGTGGSGGGAGVSNITSYLTGADGTPTQGSKGGDVTILGNNGRHGAGGGGANGFGGNTTSSGGVTIGAGAGGIGISSSITGTLTYYGGGGGGGGSSASGASGGASGGIGGGGNGATYNGTSLTAAATAGTANTGGGGGGGIGTGGSGASVGGAGGSGIIIIRYSLAPSNSASPSISGIVTYGETLTATNGSWLYTPTSYTYQWSRAATVGGTYSNITGATSATYNLVSADVGQFLKVTVTAANTGGSSAATSAATIAIPKTDKSAVISIQAGALVYRQSKQITATTTVPGKITFLANGKRIAGCISRRVSSANSYTAVCNYRPSVRGQITISTTFAPDDPSYSGKVATSERLNVGQRATYR